MPSQKWYSGIIFLLFIAWFAFPGRCDPDPGHAFSSIHRENLEAHRHLTPVRYDMSLDVIPHERLSRLVYGWYPYWMGSSYLNFRWDLISHLSFFCLETNSQGTIIDDHGWPDNWSGLIQTARNAGIPITLTCTLFSSSDINTLIGTEQYRLNLITNLINACLDGGAEGINIDFEGTGLHKDNLTDFMVMLSAALQSAIPGAHLSMATPSVDWTSCFDYDRLGAVCDQLIPMCYGYHWSGGNPGPVAPLTAGDVWGQYCVEWTVDDYLDPDYGIGPEKLAIGLPYYGRDWIVSGDPASYPASDGAGSGEALTYSAIRTGFESIEKHWDPHSQTPWFYYYDSSDPHQAWYDDALSLGFKYDLVNTRNLAGIAIWALGYDDGYQDLWQVLDDHFTDLSTPTPDPSPTATSPPPTSTPDVTGIDLVLGKSVVVPGDRFKLICSILNSKSVPLEDQPVVILLEVFNRFYFYPDWTESFDYVLADIQPGQTDLMILDFIWPEFPTPGTGNGYGALLTKDLTGIIGNWDHETFIWTGN
jgi:spore germination protein YaaH